MEMRLTRDDVPENQNAEEMETLLSRHGTKRQRTRYLELLPCYREGKKKARSTCQWWEQISAQLLDGIESLRIWFRNTNGSNGYSVRHFAQCGFVEQLSK